jgi:hypothetical protein
MVIFKQRENNNRYLISDWLRPDGTLGAGRCQARLSIQLRLRLTGFL